MACPPESDLPISRKRPRKLLEPEPLLPGLPDHLAHLCLVHVPHCTLYSVCHSWRRLTYSSCFRPFLSLYAVLSTVRSDSSSSSLTVDFQSYDPLSSTWVPLPSPPPFHPPLLLRHPSFLSRDFPVQTVAAGDHLAVVAATATRNLLPALPSPLLFSPSLKKWRFASPFAAPRRWCAGAGSTGAIYVGSGVGSEFSPTVARSMEKLTISDDRWESLRPLPDGRFSREAVTGVSVNNKIYMVNTNNHEYKDGIVYDVREDRWGPMPEGMVKGWVGPAAGADDTIYVVEEEGGRMWRYEFGRDEWTVVIEDERLRGTVQIEAGGGRVCVVVDGGRKVAVVDVKGRRVWVVEAPQGRRILAVHVLPRMSVD